MDEHKMLNAKDLKNLQAFLNRVDLKGNEAIALADIQIKIVGMLQSLENPQTPPPKKDDDDT